MKNIHVVATDKPSRIKQEYMNKASYALSRLPLTWRFAQHIYITNDEEIREGDFVYSTNEDYNIQKVPSEKSVKAYRDCGHYKKIILTTDQDLIADGFQAIDDTFLEWFVKNPSCEEVEIKEKQHFQADKSKRKNPLNGVYYSYKIIIPKEESKQTVQEYEQQVLEKYSYELEPKQETLEEGFNRIHNSMDFSEFDFASFKLGTKWQQERMYSEEEVGELVYNIIGEYGKQYGIMIDGAKLNELFKQFKKK